MYQVFDNEKLADCISHKVDLTWKNSSFKTLKEARAYARNWLGLWAPGILLKVNKPFDYSGYGDIIEIRKV